MQALGIDSFSWRSRQWHNRSPVAHLGLLRLMIYRSKKKNDRADAVKLASAPYQRSSHCAHDIIKRAGMARVDYIAPLKGPTSDVRTTFQILETYLYIRSDSSPADRCHSNRPRRYRHLGFVYSSRHSLPGTDSNVGRQKTSTASCLTETPL